MKSTRKITSEIKTEKNSRIMKVLSVYLKLSSEKKVKSKIFFCTRRGNNQENECLVGMYILSHV